MSKENYIALLLLNSKIENILITPIYGKHGDKCELDELKPGEYNFFGTTALDYYEPVKTNYKNSRLVGAVNSLSLYKACLSPADTLLRPSFANPPALKLRRASTSADEKRYFLFGGLVRLSP